MEELASDGGDGACLASQSAMARKVRSCLARFKLKLQPRSTKETVPPCPSYSIAPKCCVWAVDLVSL